MAIADSPGCLILLYLDAPQDFGGEVSTAVLDVIWSGEVFDDLRTTRQIRDKPVAIGYSAPCL